MWELPDSNIYTRSTAVTPLGSYPDNAVRSVVLRWQSRGRALLRNIHDDTHITIRRGRRVHAPEPQRPIGLLGAGARRCLCVIRARRRVRRYVRGDSGSLRRKHHSAPQYSHYSIGIGAGLGTRGQVLIWGNMMTMTRWYGRKAKFVRRFPDVGHEEGLHIQNTSVWCGGSFPNAEMEG